MDTGIPGVSGTDVRSVVGWESSKTFRRVTVLARSLLQVPLNENIGGQSGRQRAPPDETPGMATWDSGSARALRFHKRDSSASKDIPSFVSHIGVPLFSKG